MDGDLEIIFLGFLECWSKDGYLSYSWISAEVNANDTLVSKFDGKVHDFESDREIVPTINREDQVCFHGG